MITSGTRYRMKLYNDFESYRVILWKKNSKRVEYQMRFLSFDFLDEDFDFILFLKFDFPDAISDSELPDLIRSLEIAMIDYLNVFVILTKKKKAPLFTQSTDEFIYSFCCSFSNFKQLVKKWGRTSFIPNTFLFDLLDYIFGINAVIERIIIRQIPILDNPDISATPADIIIPHRGEQAYLESVLYFLNQFKGVNVHVGLDQKLNPAMRSLCAKYRHYQFYAFKPDPVGPYIIRNYLIEQSNNEMIFFQDSDDIPCADRFMHINAYMNSSGAELCGSHEVRLDYFDKTVRAYRFPLNVVSALSQGPTYSLLHSTSAIRRNSFYLCGKLSEERRYGNDTKFLLNSFFVLSNIKNIDEFLYIRRRHSGSLTTSEETMIGSPARRSLLFEWYCDFEEIRLGEMKLDDSSLKYAMPTITYHANKFYN